nr:hypothetical protein [uncultured Rhodopila sp.]
MKCIFLLPMAALASCAAQPPQIAKTLPLPPKTETWEPQEVATNVQDWDRAAKRFADGLQNQGLLTYQTGQRAGHNDMRVSQLTSTATDAVRGSSTFEQNLVGEPSRGHAFSVKLAHDSVFLRQMQGAIENEVIGRGGPAADMHVDLTVDVVPWGSRLQSQPSEQRREAVWQATVTAGDKIMSFREPFYIYESDVKLYAQQPPQSSPDEELRNSARPLRYTTH